MRRQVASLAVLLAGATALVGPAVAEWSALGSLREALARCPSDGSPRCGGVARADVDLGGLRLWHPWREQGGLRVEAQRVTATLDTTGLRIDAEGARLRAATAPAAEPSGHGSPAPIEPTPPATPTRTRATLDTHGVPVHVRVHGSLGLDQGGLSLTLGDPELHLDGHGAATAGFTVQVEGRGLRAEGTERWVATPTDDDLRRWRAAGPLTIAEGPAVPAVLTVSREGLEADVRDPEGGWLSVRAPLPTDGPHPAALRLGAKDFGVAALGRLGRRTLADLGIDASKTRIDASLRAEGLGARDERGELEVDHLVLHGLVVDHRKLAREPVALDALDLRGRLAWQGEHDLSGELWIAHRGARIAFDLQRTEDALDVRTELAPLPCQDLLDAFPAAMSEMVEGTRLRGEIGGQADVHVDRRALAQARAQPDRRPDDPAPGTLDLRFPFLERCTVDQDDPRLDLAALWGPYRHRFIDHRGKEQRRVMAPGAPGYVAIYEVPLLARAFVALEDRRFWRHDGFDREQMRNAFWHNVVEGRVSRGASTISQQAARNLWLGIDRSWGRKLQEALLTARLESAVDKRRIMELYLNVIELGPGTHGVQEAALLYFGKPASELTVLQAVHLAALAPAPTRYAERFVDGRVDAEWLDALRGHVRRMARAGLITHRQLVQALRDDLRLLDRRDDSRPT
ncbi:MAG: transglycosylase domain-containing protein [Myxococcales bacterium]|nr:transglycosylase domain-containing protein [Myxococcales bacterium]